MNAPIFAMLGWPEIVMILVVVLILFGAKRLPELAKGLGSGIKEFKKASKDVQDDIQRAIEDDDDRPSPPKAPSYRPTESTQPRGKEESKVESPSSK